MTLTRLIQTGFNAALLFVALSFVAIAQAAIPTYQARGEAKSATGSVSPPWPTHVAGDVALLFVESAQGQAVTLSTPAGFVQIAGSPQFTAATEAGADADDAAKIGTRITVFWARATSAGMAAPTVADAGDHVNARILTYRGVTATGDPWDVTSGGAKSIPSTSISVTGVTTTVADALIVQVAAKDIDSDSDGFSDYSNATLTNIAERTDIGTTKGNGGGFSVWDGGKAVAGVVTNTTATVESSVNAFMTIALKPAVVNPPATNCYTDNFDRTTGLLATGDWTRTKSAGTAFDAEIVNGKLRLTDAVGNRATAVHLSRLFPGAGNKVVAEFNYFAYNGTATGADGIVITLSDASVAPVAGAFGGSLGYAQKSNPGSDCTTVGGCPGFAGGWIGVGLDEFGNYSAATEGRVDGPGVQADTVTIRGSGAGQTGYNYHRRSTILVPGVDSPGTTVAPGHRYRVTVDHSDGVHAWVTVDRDTTGLGTSYSNVVATYDAKAFATQAAVPTNWFFSFTGSTGGSTNIHEIDNMTVCASQPMVTPALDHVRIIHDGAAQTCSPEIITLKACANAACDALYTGPVTVNMAAIAGATWSPVNPVTISGGQTTVTLSNGTVNTVTLGGTIASPTAVTTAAVCYNGATSGNCSLTFSSGSCLFDAVELNQNVSTPIYTKLAGVSFDLSVIAVAKSTISALDLVDLSSGTCASPAAVLSPVTISPLLSAAGVDKFTAGQKKTFNFTYANAAPNVRVRIMQGTTPICSSDSFAIRPQSFSTVAATLGGATLKAGSNFTLTATTAVASGYAGSTPVLDTALVKDHNNAAAATLAGSFSAATGVSAAGIFQYHDVGTISLSADAVKDSGFTAADQSVADRDCVASSTSNVITTPAPGKYGCNIGSVAAGPFGRFIPDHFTYATTLTPACAAGGFTYMDQPTLGVSLSLEARSTNETKTVRYTDGYANVGTFAITGDNGGAAVAVTGATSRLSAALPAFVWTAGAYSVTGDRSFTKATAADGPYDSFALKATVTDPDSVAITGAATSNTTKIRYGKLKLSNAHGSELLPLPIALTAQYWNGSSYVQNTLDSCTTLPASSVRMEMDANTPNLVACETTLSPTATLSFVNGAIAGGLALTKPGSGNNGSVLLTVNSAAASGNTCLAATQSSATDAALPWLPSNSARATFGIYKGNNEFIYLRESY